MLILDRAIRVPRRGIPQINTEASARDYFQQLKGITDTTETLVTELILPQLPQLFRIRDVLTPELSTEDGIQDDIANLVDGAKRVLAERLAPRAREIALATALETSTIHREQQRRQFQAQGRQTMTDSPATSTLVEGFTVRNQRFILDIPRQELERIGDVISKGLSTGQSQNEVTARIRKEFEIAENRGKLIAVDQVGDLTGSLSKARNRVNAVTQFIWRTRKDDRVRQRHRQLEGRVFSWARGAPGEGLPGEPIRCRCVAESLIV